MDGLELTKEFEEAIAAISNDIAQNPQKYKQTGEWLDQYHDKDFSQAKMLKFSKRTISLYGLSDGEEVYMYGTDPLNPDTDGGGVNDGEELFVYGTDPLDPSDDVVVAELSPNLLLILSS